MYFEDSKSCMQIEIMEKILETLKYEMVNQERNVILFLDNATVHPTSLADKFSNIKVVFLPKNTTSLPKFQIKVSKEVNALCYCTCQRGFTSLRNCEVN